MPEALRTDDRVESVDKRAVGAGRIARSRGSAGRTQSDMTAFVESCVETAADSAVAAERKSHGRPRARRLLHLLADKQNILVTTHLHPDPDALASSMAL